MNASCKSCSTDLKENSRFCHVCGKMVVREAEVFEYVCPNCGFDTTSDAKYCHECGEEFTPHNEGSLDDNQFEIVQGVDWKRVGFLLVVLAIVIGLGFSGYTRFVNRNSGEVENVEGLLEDWAINNHQGSSVTCPQEIPTYNGEKFTCWLYNSIGGDRGYFEVTINGGAGHYSWVFHK